MKFALILSLAAAVLAGCATKNDTGLPASLEARFKQADRDGDGKVSRKEFTDYLIADAFARYDADGKGYVTLEEFVAGGGTPATFRKIDTTNAGRFTLAQAQSSKVVADFMAKPFDEADSNHSGFVTLEEFVAARQRAQDYVR